MKKGRKKLTNEPAVFVLEKGSQYKGTISEGKYFSAFFEMFENLLATNGVESDMVGFSGCKLDMAVFLAKFLSMAEFQGTELRMKEGATHDFNPDSSPC